MKCVSLNKELVLCTVSRRRKKKKKSTSAAALYVTLCTTRGAHRGSTCVAYEVNVHSSRKKRKKKRKEKRKKEIKEESTLRSRTESADYNICGIWIMDRRYQGRAQAPGVLTFMMPKGAWVGKKRRREKKIKKEKDASVEQSWHRLSGTVS